MALSRPVTLDLDSFEDQLRRGVLKPMAYSRKMDGFHVVVRRGELDGVVGFYSHDGKHELIQSRNRTLAAIGRYLVDKHSDLDPWEVYLRTGSSSYPLLVRSRALHLEFVARKADDPQRDCLEALFLGRCVDPATGHLMEGPYEYRVFIHDADYVLYSEPMRVPWYVRMSPVIYAFGFDRVVEWIRSWPEVKQCLLTSEGVVAYPEFGCGPPVKIKLIKYPVRALLTAVCCTIDDFMGYDQLLFCVPDLTAGCLWGVYMADFRDVFTDYTRPSKGKAFVSRKSVKVVHEEGSVLTCQSKSVLGPLLDRLYRRISVAGLHPPAKTSRTIARCDAGVVRCGDTRSFGLDRRMLYLREPIEVTLGAMDLWLLNSGEAEDVHLQATRIVAFSDYGPERFRDLPVASMASLLDVARTKPSAEEAYRRVGMKTGPLDGADGNGFPDMDILRFML